MKDIKEKIPVRSYTGEMWKTNKTNKKKLSEDFEKKCAYCDDKDYYSGGYKSYHVEHFAPKEQFKHLEFVYDNLLYSCPYCNISKSNKWVGKTEYENIVGNKGFIDPCTSEYNNHLKRNENGSITYITTIGEYMYYELKLYLKRHELIYNLERFRIKKKELKKKIDEMRQKNENIENLEVLYKQLCVVFCDYYDLLLDED